MRRPFLILLLVALAGHVRALIPIEEPHLGDETGIAPAFFGPNAFPVPDMTDGTAEETLDIELAGDGYWGKEGDRTADVFARLRVPLFSRWANLVVWMPVQEWYSMPPERLQTCRVPRTDTITGHGAGDVYVSTDIQVLSHLWLAEGRCSMSLTRAHWIPDAMLQVGLKTASGGQFGLARHYDNPGYWLSLTAGESLLPMDMPVALRLSGSIGFLCWQTDNGRQNDAVLYGLMLTMKHPYVSLRASWQGYNGWELYGDRPMLVTARLSGHAGGWSPYVEYKQGLRDYPFTQVRIGLIYSLEILNKHK